MKNISTHHLESAAHESLAAHCIPRAAAWSHLGKKVYSGEFIESGSDGPLDSRRISRQKHGRCATIIVGYFYSVYSSVMIAVQHIMR